MDAFFVSYTPTSTPDHQPLVLLTANYYSVAKLILVSMLSGGQLVYHCRFLTAQPEQLVLVVLSITSACRHLLVVRNKEFYIKPP